MHRLQLLRHVGLLGSFWTKDQIRILLHWQGGLNHPGSAPQMSLDERLWFLQMTSCGLLWTERRNADVFCLLGFICVKNSKILCVSLRDRTLLHGCATVSRLPLPSHPLPSATSNCWNLLLGTQKVMESEQNTSLA